MRETWRRIETWLADHAPDVLKSLNGPASEQDLRQAEEISGLRLPDEVRAAYQIHDGQAETLYFFDGMYYLLPLADALDQWKLMAELLATEPGFQALADTGEADGGVRQDHWRRAWFPIAANGCGDLYCADNDPAPDGAAGQLIEFIHDDSLRRLLARDFRTWLADFAAALESGQYVFSEKYGGLVQKNLL